MMVAVLWWAPGKLLAQPAAGDQAARIRDIQRTDDQEAAIADIRTEYRPKVQEAGKELAAGAKDEVEKVRFVLTPEQKTNLEAKEGRQERRAAGLAAAAAPDRGAAFRAPGRQAVGGVGRPAPCRPGMRRQRT
jgi:hypothetical protein